MMFEDVRRYLDGRGVGCACLPRIGLPAREPARSALLVVDDALAVVVVPEPDGIDHAHLAEVLGARGARPATVALAERHGVPECAPGTLPPFGNLWGLPVYVASCLCERDELTFYAGRRDTCMRVRMVDFVRLVHPVAVELAIPRLPGARWRAGVGSAM